MGTYRGTNIHDIFACSFLFQFLCVQAYEHTRVHTRTPIYIQLRTQTRACKRANTTQAHARTQTQARATRYGSRKSVGYWVHVEHIGKRGWGKGHLFKGAHRCTSKETGWRNSSGETKKGMLSRVTVVPFAVPQSYASPRWPSARPPRLFRCWQRSGCASFSSGSAILEAVGVQQGHKIAKKEVQRPGLMRAVQGRRFRGGQSGRRMANAGTQPKPTPLHLGFPGWLWPAACQRELRIA